MAHGRDDGDGAGEDGPDDRFKVERPQVFGRTTASAHDDGVHRRQAEALRHLGAGQGSRDGQAAYDFLGGVFALDEDFDNGGSHAGPAVGHELAHVRKRC